MKIKQLIEVLPRETWLTSKEILEAANLNGLETTPEVIRVQLNKYTKRDVFYRRDVGEMKAGTHGKTHFEYLLPNEAI